MTMVTMVMKLRTDRAYRFGAVTTIQGSGKQIVGLLAELLTEAPLLRTNLWLSSNGCGNDIQLEG